MDKNELIRKYTGAQSSDPEDRILLARVLDKLEACRKGNVVAYTKFLNERQQVLVRNLLAGVGQPSHLFFGGYEGAARTVLFFLPDYIEEAYFLAEDLPIAYLRAVYSAETRLSHRDFLGSLMGCGIQRETVGDILPGEGSCDLIVLEEIQPFLLTSMESAGKAKLKLKEITRDELRIPEAEFKIVKDTVASLRLDNIVSAGFLISREKASEAIRTGRVTLNHLECTKPDKAVAEGDRISLRGGGKIELGEIGKLTKKGRTSITIRKYQ